MSALFTLMKKSLAIWLSPLAGGFSVALFLAIRSLLMPNPVSPLSAFFVWLIERAGVGYILTLPLFPAVATAVETEVQRFIRSEPLSREAKTFRSIAEVFAAPKMLENVALHYFIIPTRSEWTAIWTSTFLCSGYDSLSVCLTKNHGFDTVHFESSDTNGPFQPGTVFSHRTKSDERHVAAIQEDTRWTFHATGTPLPEEDVARYQKRKIRDRWNPEALLLLLKQIGIRPWSENFYDFSAPIIHLERAAARSTITRITREEFAARHQSKKG